MRARNIKPGFFLNEKLAECDFKTRLLFIGLWCYADREGRFEWIPKRIEAAIFPYDKNVNVEKCLCNLMSLHLITSYTHGNVKVGYIENFVKHQKPHPHEAKSDLPEKPYVSHCEQTPPLNVITCHDKVGECRSDIINDDIINDDIRKEDIRKEKKLFMDCVYLSDRETESLKKLYGDVGCLDRIKNLNDAIMSKGYKYKSHYHTILTWERKNKPLISTKPKLCCALCTTEFNERETTYDYEGKKICGKCDMQKTKEKLGKSGG